MGYSALKIEVKNACKILLPNPGSLNAVDNIKKGLRTSLVSECGLNWPRTKSGGRI